MHVHMYVCMNMLMYMCKHVYVTVQALSTNLATSFFDVCMNPHVVSMHICIIHLRLYPYTQTSLYPNTRTCMHIPVYTSTHACICKHAYMYICMYITCGCGDEDIVHVSVTWLRNLLS